MKSNIRSTRFSIRRSADRGHARHGWLDSRHSFSFADYYDPAHLGFRSLRVINEDRVAPLGGFPEHPHRDMEIFSYIIEGELAHRDSLGNQRVLKPGEIQVMSAGSGISHSEFNPSSHEAARFLQIWILPDRRDLQPEYAESRHRTDHGAKVLLISPDGRDGSARIHQDASVHRLRLGPGGSQNHRLAEGRGLWLQVISGQFKVGDKLLEAGDALATEIPGEIEFEAGDEPAEALLFDLA